MLSTPAPVFIDRLRPVGLRAYAPEGGLDWNDVVSGDGPFSDSNGQHSHRITDKDSDASLKRKNGKILMGWNLTAKSVKIWVETINYGLNIGEFSARWAY